MSLGGLVAKFSVALLLTAGGVYFLTTPGAQGAPPPPSDIVIDYKVEWTATKFLVINFEKLMYPAGRNGINYGPDPLDHGAKTRLAIGVAEWQVSYKVNDGNGNFTEKYFEKWQTGADHYPSFATDNCYKVPDNCKPAANGQLAGKYAGEWNWSLGAYGVETGFLNQYIVPGAPGLRSLVEVSTTDVTDPNLYVNNSKIYTDSTGKDWKFSQGNGPGFLEAYQCLPGTGCWPGIYPGNSGVNEPNKLLEYVYTSAPYTWQSGGSFYSPGLPGSDMGTGTVMTGTLAPTKWFVTGTLYNGN